MELIKKQLQYTKTFATHSFERLMTNDEKRLSMLRSFAKRALTPEVVEGKRILELNATNTTFTNFLLDNGASSYNGINFNPEVTKRLTDQNDEKDNVKYGLLENNTSFVDYEDYDLVVSFGFIESLTRFELFDFFKGSENCLHIHSFMNNNSEFKNSLKRIFVNGFPMSHDIDYVLSSLNKDKEWNSLSSKNFRDHVIIMNF